MENPRPVRAGYADCRFGQIHYVERQLLPTANLPPLIFLNPRSRSCRKLLPLFEKDRPVFIVDILAYGGSSPPPESCTMYDVAETIIAFMDHSKVLSTHVCGFHTGAKVAAALAYYWPNRVRSLVVCGKSHSLIPDHDTRNNAMRQQIAARKPDVALLAMESFRVDDDEQVRGQTRVYDANFAFDFAAALSSARCPKLIVEITSEEEDLFHGRQARLLASISANAEALEIAEVEAMGLDLYVGARALAGPLREFIVAHD